MATKRRKMWVNEYDADDEGPGGLGDLAWTTKAAAALASISSDGKAVPFIERLPGDVVLSREELVTAFVAFGYQIPTAEKLAAFLSRRGRR